MVVTGTANRPITFGGQIVSYAAGVADTYQERKIVGTQNVPVEFTNANGSVQYTQSGTGSSGLQAYVTR